MLQVDLLLRIRQRMLEFDDLRVCHVYREANMCADLLARMDCDQEDGFQVYEHGMLLCSCSKR